MELPYLKDCKAVVDFCHTWRKGPLCFISDGNGGVEAVADRCGDAVAMVFVNESAKEIAEAFANALRIADELRPPKMVVPMAAELAKEEG